MKTLLKEEITATTSKKIFVEEDGSKSVEYYFIDRYGSWRRTNISMWAITKYRETHDLNLENPVL